MPSAGRPFTAELVTRLVSSGVLVAPIVLHTGRVLARARRAALSRAVSGARDDGGARQRRPRLGRPRDRGRHDGRPGARDGRRRRTEPCPQGQGWTGLVVTPERGLRAVDGLLTGLHEAESSHLQMLEAVAGAELLDRSYRAALERGYLWHEFGDVHLILP